MHYSFYGFYWRPVLELTVNSSLNLIFFLWPYQTCQESHLIRPNFQPHFSRTLSYKNSYFNRITNSWNALPEPIRSVKTFISFKALVIKKLSNTVHTISLFRRQSFYWHSICSWCYVRVHVSLPRKSSVHCCISHTVLLN